jgi:hypothetical protein
MRLFAVIVEDNPTFATIFNGKISINFMLLDFALPGVTSEVSGVQLIIFIQIIIHEHIWCLFGYVLCPRMIKFMVNFTGSAFIFNEIQKPEVLQHRECRNLEERVERRIFSHFYQLYCLSKEKLR